MSLDRRQWLTRSLQGLCATAICSGLPRAWANGSIRLLVGFPPGGGTDTLAHLLAPYLHQELGVDVIVDSRPGVGGQVAAQALKTATPDGRTLMLSHEHTISILPRVLQQPGFDAQHDFQPVVGIASFVNGLAVAAEHPAQDWDGFVRWIERQHKPSMLAVGVPAPASTLEVFVARLAGFCKKKLVPVPYRGSAPMIADLLAGQIQSGTGSINEFMELHNAGKVRVLAVMGSERLAALPDVPTLAEVGIAGFEKRPFFGLYGPKGMSAQQIERIEQAVHKVLQRPQVQQRLQQWSMALHYMDHQQLDAAEKDYSAHWGPIIEAHMAEKNRAENNRAEKPNPN